ncbi:MULTISPECIES: TetR/AcrR family transcriptional regulator [unclassified Rhodococcus (in: high G+C Gram-positive bacteria)]|uniref:TetR/AcrR family transcriptional regulator n=1 Tax=unclassified Rhodococcus (in: high G+C Gram-positive bacteria) TaxID=192944 RepID=UPI0009F9FD0F|nr:TetR/AcrR family transcriptional regulator [Rhodococcus sp. M8]QPG44824.1 TetR family transcriptional regulator [Rhodococcus sp. M8]
MIDTPITDRNDLTGIFTEVESDVARRLIGSAVESFARRGYHATTTRDISVGAGLSPAALYVHFKSKEEVLFEASRIGHQHVLDAVVAAAASATEPADRMRAIVDGFVRTHAVHHTVCRVAQYELHALTPEHYRTIAAIRRDTDAVIRAEIENGIAAGVFTVRDVPTTALAILSLGIDVARWYQPGRIDVDTLAGNYVELVLGMLGAGTMQG